MSAGERAITTVIATIGRPALLRRTLLSIKAARKPPGYRGVIVVENGPQQLVKGLVEGEDWGCPARYHYLRESNKSKALNAALAQVPGGLAYFNDDDVRIEAHTLTAMHEAAQGLSGKFFLGGPLGIEYEKEPPEWIRQYFTHGDGWAYPSLSVARVTEACFFGANWAAAAEDIRRAGGFPERFGPTQSSRGEDTKVQRLLMACGIPGYYVPGARVWHYMPPEACTPAHVLREGYRRSFSAAVFDDSPFRARCAGALKDTYFILRAGSLWAWYSLVRDSMKAFAQRYTVTWRCGNLMGRLQRRWRHP